MPRNAPRWPTAELIARFNSLAERAGFKGKHYDSSRPSRWHFLTAIFDFVEKNLDLFRRR